MMSDMQIVLILDAKWPVMSDMRIVLILDAKWPVISDMRIVLILMFLYQNSICSVCASLNTNNKEDVYKRPGILLGHIFTITSFQHNLLHIFSTQSSTHPSNTSIF